jgi:hypothetical protein
MLRYVEHIIVRSFQGVKYITNKMAKAHRYTCGASAVYAGIIHPENNFVNTFY